MTGSEDSTSRIEDHPLAMGPNEPDLENCEQSRADARKKSLHLRLETPKKRRTLRGFFYIWRRTIARADPNWIKLNMDASHIKPIIRTTVSAWICVILLVASRTQAVMGQVSASRVFCFTRSDNP